MLLTPQKICWFIYTIIDRPNDPDVKYIIERMGLTNAQLATLTQGYFKKLPPIPAGASLFDQVGRIDDILNYVAALEIIATKNPKRLKQQLLKFGELSSPESNPPFQSMLDLLNDLEQKQRQSLGISCFLILLLAGDILNLTLFLQNKDKSSGGSTSKDDQNPNASYIVLGSVMSFIFVANLVSLLYFKVMVIQPLNNKYVQIQSIVLALIQSISQLKENDPIKKMIESIILKTIKTQLLAIQDYLRLNNQAILYYSSYAAKKDALAEQNVLVHEAIEAHQMELLNKTTPLEAEATQSQQAFAPGSEEYAQSVMRFIAINNYKKNINVSKTQKNNLQHNFVTTYGAFFSDIESTLQKHSKVNNRLNEARLQLVSTTNEPTEAIEIAIEMNDRLPLISS